jgi:hypothetical protein
VHFAFLLTPPCTAVAEVDGTTSGAGKYEWECPRVAPNAPIYFYQFSTQANASAKYWTTRFTIADANGHFDKAPNPTQPDGAKIPWGEGALLNKADAVPAPNITAIATHTRAVSSTSTSSGFVTSRTGSASATGPAASATASKSAARREHAWGKFVLGGLGVIYASVLSVV